MALYNEIVEKIKHLNPVPDIKANNNVFWYNNELKVLYFGVHRTWNVVTPEMLEHFIYNYGRQLLQEELESLIEDKEPEMVTGMPLLGYTDMGRLRIFLMFDEITYEIDMFKNKLTPLVRTKEGTENTTEETSDYAEETSDYAEETSSDSYYDIGHKDIQDTEGTILWDSDHLKYIKCFSETRTPELVLYYNHDSSDRTEHNLPKDANKFKYEQIPDIKNYRRTFVYTLFNNEGEPLQVGYHGKKDSNIGYHGKKGSTTLTVIRKGNDIYYETDDSGLLPWSKFKTYDESLYKLIQNDSDLKREYTCTEKFLDDDLESVELFINYNVFKGQKYEKNMIIFAKLIRQYFDFGYF